jgi:hypothetical protein
MTTAACPAYGHLNPSRKRFCGDCAAPLYRACPSCGTGTPPGKLFCGD